MSGRRRGDDGKPRPAPTTGKYVRANRLKFRKRANKRILATAAARPFEQTIRDHYEMKVWDHTPSGGRSGLVFMTSQGGSYTGNPAEMAARWMRKQLNRPPRANVTVYDAAGKPIAIIDGETRERRPLP